MDIWTSCSKGLAYNKKICLGTKITTLWAKLVARGAVDINASKILGLHVRNFTSKSYYNDSVRCEVGWIWKWIRVIKELLTMSRIFVMCFEENWVVCTIAPMGDVLAGLVRVGRHRKTGPELLQNPLVTARVACIHFALAQAKQNGYCVQVSEMLLHISFVIRISNMVSLSDLPLPGGAQGSNPGYSFSPTILPLPTDRLTSSSQPQQLGLQGSSVPITTLQRKTLLVERTFFQMEREAPTGQVTSSYHQLRWLTTRLGLACVKNCMGGV